MKRLYLLVILSGFLSFTFAQTSQYKLVKVNRNLWRPSGKNTTGSAYLPLKKKSIVSAAGSRALDYDTLGQAGNLFTILEGEVHSIALNPNLNTLTFIHRANQDQIPADNIAQFLYDVSTDGGNTWANNNGPLDPIANNVSLAGRYPNVAIYNPQGNINPDSAYLAYMGAWLPYNNGSENTSTTWRGFLGGVGSFDNNPATYTEHVTDFNDSNVIIAHSLCNGLPGQFWACDMSSTNGVSVDGFLLYKGVWSDSTHDIVWSLNQKFTPNFNPHDSFAVNTVAMAFDPTGTYGWLAANADISTDTPYVYRPVFYHTVDGGVTWNGPIDVVLDSMPNIVSVLPKAAEVVRPDCLGQISIGVDYKGNPHLELLVLPGINESYYEVGNFKMYDITLNAAGQWISILLDSVQSFDGTFDVASSDNRPQVSTTPDATKVVFGWLDTNLSETGATGNTFPDLYSLIYDVNSGLADTVIDETGNDPVWSESALFATFPVYSFLQGNTVQVPTVFAQLNKSGLSTDPASFFYYHNTTHDLLSITQDITPPVIYLNGCNPVVVAINSIYTDAGATAIDNVDGNVTANILTTPANGGISTATAGTYYIHYSVTDNAGNTGYASRTVIVSSIAPPLPVLTLNGADTITVDQCMSFVDPGITAQEIIGSDTVNITSGITTNASSIPFPTDSSKGTAGTYTLVYAVTNCSGSDTITRTIIIGTTVGVDAAGPEFTFANGDTDYVYLGTKYVDTLPSASDCAGIDTIYSNADSVITTTDTPDTVLVTYTAIDSSGNVGKGTRVVIINSEPTPAFTDYSTNRGYFFIDQSTNNPSAWEWNFGDNTGSSLQNPQPHVFTPHDTTYNICLTVSNIFNTKYEKPKKTLCDSIYVYGVTQGIEQAALNNSFIIYPNPTTGNVTLDINSVGFATMDVAIFNMLGENVKNLDVTGVPAQSKYDIDLSSFSRGVYLVRIQTEKGTVTRKVTLFSGN